jgi:alpha-tubulin suppressor-like RCC1 family protein
MNNLLKLVTLSLSVITMAVSLTACGGGGGSSAIPTTVPNSETVFYAHNVIFRNSTTVATGYNGFGQLGTGNLGSRVIPGVVKGKLTFNGVATGGNHTVAFMNNSTVHTWGSNIYGQLGTNSTTHSDIPVRTTTSTDKTEDLPLRGVIAVAAGSRHSLALRTDGTVWSWGENTYGQLGVPTSETPKDKGVSISKVAVPVKRSSGDPLNNIVAIAANGLFSVALDSAGTVYAWGLNGSGQIGIDPKTTGASAEPTLVPFPAGTVIVAIAAGGASGYAIDTDGTLWSWGNNFNGQLGDGTTTDTSIPVPVTLTDKAVQVSGGIQHVLIRLADGSVWSCGYNIFGQLGNNDKTKKDRSTPVQVVANEGGGTFFSNATDIRAFGSSSMAKKDGKWYVWGDNTYGQLGTGGKGTIMVPVKMSGF